MDMLPINLANPVWHIVLLECDIPHGFFATNPPFFGLIRVKFKL